jgi:hypothetical protein
MWTASFTLHSTRHLHDDHVDSAVARVGTATSHDYHAWIRVQICGSAPACPYPLLSPPDMARLPYVPQQSVKASDDEQQWEDEPNDERPYRSRSPSATTSGSFKSAARTRRTVRQRVGYAATSPRKHIPVDYRGPGRARRERERGFVVELPTQELLDTSAPEHGYPTRQQLFQDLTRSSVQQHSSPIQPLLKDPMGYPVLQGSSSVEQPQQPSGTPAPQHRSKVEQPSQQLVGTPGPEFLNVLATSLTPALCYITEVLGTVLRIMKYPISITLAVLACAYVLAIMSGAIKTALAPICHVPVISLLCPFTGPSKPSPPSNPERTPVWADFPGLVNVESKSLGALLDETVEGPGLALEIKKAEMATSDLATRVRVSNLKSRQMLADSLSDFVNDARKASRGLTRFSSKVGGAVDTYVHPLSEFM